jgi:hypothetical protein
MVFGESYSLSTTRVVEVLSSQCGSDGGCFIFLVFSLRWQVSSLVKVPKGNGRPWRVDDGDRGRVFSLSNFWRLDL